MVPEGNDDAANIDIIDVSGPSSALQQAIDDQLPTKPPQALTRSIPNSLHSPYATSPFFRGPQLMNTLARSTLPTYCQSCGPDATAHLPILVNQEPPSRTSLESLRSFTQRKMHTSAPQSKPFTPSPTRSWFHRENKRSVDQLLVEEDRAETVTGEEENIRRKCKAHYMAGMDLVDHSEYRSIPRLSNRVLSWPAWI